MGPIKKQMNFIKVILIFSFILCPNMDSSLLVLSLNASFRYNKTKPVAQTASSCSYLRPALQTAPLWSEKDIFKVQFEVSIHPWHSDRPECG